MMPKDINLAPPPFALRIKRMSSAAAKAAVKPRCLIAYIFTHRFPRQTQIKVIYDDFVLQMKVRTLF